MLLQECPIFTIFVLEMAGKARIPGCLMNVVKMADGRWLMADVIPLRPVSYNDAPRFLPILRSRYWEICCFSSDKHDRGQILHVITSGRDVFTRGRYFFTRGRYFFTRGRDVFRSGVLTDHSHQPRQNSFYDLSHHACKYIIVITVNEPSPLAPLTPALGAGGVGGVGCFLLVPIIIREAHGDNL